MKKEPDYVKVVDLEGRVRCASGSFGICREERWDKDGKVAKFNLAFIHLGICRKDNGRVLGYDNAHGYTERHWMGTSECIEDAGHSEVLERF